MTEVGDRNPAWPAEQEGQGGGEREEGEKGEGTQRAEGEEREVIEWGERVYIDGVTKVTSRLWVRNSKIFPEYRFTSRQVWGTHKKLRGDEDRWPDRHRPDKRDEGESEGKGRRTRRKPDFFEAGGS
jgi:hypothetical protein